MGLRHLHPRMCTLMNVTASVCVCVCVCVCVWCVCKKGKDCVQTNIVWLLKEFMLCNLNFGQAMKNLT